MYMYCLGLECQASETECTCMLLTTDEPARTECTCSSFTVTRLHVHVTGTTIVDPPRGSWQSRQESQLRYEIQSLQYHAQHIRIRFDPDFYIQASPKSGSKSPTDVSALKSPMINGIADEKYKKALLKKLRQVEDLKAKVKAGESLNEGQRLKLLGEAKLREELGQVAPKPNIKLTKSDIEAAKAATPAPEEENDRKNKKETQKMRKARKNAVQTDDQKAAVGPQEHVIALLKKMKPPVHVAALSVAYKQVTGKKMKEDHKGGMLNFLRNKLSDEVLLMGTGNDTFVRLSTPTAKAVHWVRKTVRELGPILVSMVGRLYHKEHDRHFTHDFPCGVTKFLQQHLKDELAFEEQKGQEQLVDLKARSENSDSLSLQIKHILT